MSAGQTLFNEGKQPAIDYRVVTPGYFDAVGTQILKGRNFTGRRACDGPRVCLRQRSIRKAVLRKSGSRRATAQDSYDGKPLEIIGVTKNVMNDDFDNLTEPSIYASYTQDPFRGMFLSSAQALTGAAHLGCAERSKQY